MREVQSKEISKFLNGSQTKINSLDTNNADDDIGTRKYVPFCIINDFPTLPTINLKNIKSDDLWRPSSEQDEDKIINEDTLENWLEPGTMEPQTCIAIVGQTQIGKTQFLKNLLSNELKKKKRYKYMFYVSLEDISSFEELNILQFLTKKSMSLSWTHFLDEDINHKPNYFYSDKRIFKQVISRIESYKSKREIIYQNKIDNNATSETDSDSADENESVCIIFDNVDKSDFVYEHDTFNSKGIDKQEKAGYFFSYILKQGFGYGKCIILLKPWQYLQFQDKLDKMKIIFVQGVDYKGQLKIAQSKNLNLTCNKNSDHENNVNSVSPGVNCPTTTGCCICKSGHLRDCHNEIQSFFRMPLYHTQLTKLAQCSTFQNFHPVVVSAIMFLGKLKELFPIKFIEQKKLKLERIGQFAWNNYANKRYVFLVPELLSKTNLSETECTLFFTSKQFENKFSEDKSSHAFFFINALFQEFLSALWLLSLSSKDFETQLDKYEQLFLDGSFAVVHKFMSEICKNDELQIFQNTIRFWKVCEEKNLKNLEMLDDFIKKKEVVKKRKASISAFQKPSIKKKKLIEQNIEQTPANYLSNQKFCS